MQNEKQLQQKEFSIPIDILMDVSKVLIDTELKNMITGVNENRNLIHLTVLYQEGLNYHAKAIENIQVILNEYKHYRFEEEELSDWKDK